MRQLSFAALVVVGALAWSATTAPRTESGLAIVYVDINRADGAFDGSSWENAFQSLWLAMLAHPEPVQFWVAQGTYTAGIPLGDPRAYSFVVGPGQELYGGFQGDEVSLSDRPNAGRSTLSGNRGNPDIATDNTYRVLSIGLTGNETAIVDRIAVTGGYDNRSPASGGSAGGIVITGGKPQLLGVRVNENWGRDGAGIHVEGGAPVFEGLSLHLNTRLTAPETLGGISAEAGDITITNSSLLAGPPTMAGAIVDITGANSTIIGTSALSGESTTGFRLSGGQHTLAGIRVYSLGTVVNATSADVSIEGAWFDDNAAGIVTSGGTMAVRNATFTDNGPAITAGGPVAIASSTFVDNVAGVSSVTPTFTNVIVQSSGTPTPPATPSIFSHAIMDAPCGGAITCDDVTDVDPLFGPLEQIVTVEGYGMGAFPLTFGSPAIDAGGGGVCPDADAFLTPRPKDGNGDGDMVCDLGAFELDPPLIEFTGSVQALEGAPTLTLFATVTGPLYVPPTVDYRVAGGTATRGADYTIAEGTLAFPLPDCSSTGSAPGGGACIPTPDQPVTLVLLDDFRVETNETVVVELTNSVDAFIGPANRATGRILDNEPRLKCAGVAASIVGSPAADILRGTAGRDVIVGRGGNDRITSAAGNDRVCTGPGDDTVRGGGGRDLLFGHGGEDTLFGGAGNDQLRGGGADDTLAGGAGNDELLGQRGADDIRGQTGRDRLSGGPGEGDSCDGGAGTDTLLPKAGCETIAGIP